MVSTNQTRTVTWRIRLMFNLRRPVHPSQKCSPSVCGPSLYSGIVLFFFIVGVAVMCIWTPGFPSPHLWMWHTSTCLSWRRKTRCSCSSSSSASPSSVSASWSPQCLSWEQVCCLWNYSTFLCNLWLFLLFSGTLIFLFFTFYLCWDL